MSTVCWNNVLESHDNVDAAIDFVEGTLSLRNFKRALDKEARKEISKIENLGRPSSDIRILARKALRRRNVRYTVNQ